MWFIVYLAVIVRHSDICRIVQRTNILVLYYTIDTPYKLHAHCFRCTHNLHHLDIKVYVYGRLCNVMPPG